MKKILITLLSAWLLIAFGAPLFLSSMIEQKITHLSRPEIEIIDYHKGYFSSTVKIRVIISQLGLMKESEEKIVHSPLLFSGLNWVKFDGNFLHGQMTFDGKILAFIENIKWQSQIFTPEKGMLSTKELLLPLNYGVLNLQPLQAEVFLSEKRLMSSTFSGHFERGKKTIPIKGENLTLSQHGNHIFFQCAKVTLGNGKTFNAEIKGEFNQQQKTLTTTIVPKLSFPLTAFNEQPLIATFNGQEIIINSKNNNHLRGVINLAEQQGIVLLNPAFVQKGGLALLLKYQFGELPQERDGSLLLSFSWHEKGLTVNGKQMRFF